jgi:prepilin-type N-terminal cleavage/methylation domain-containing protein
MSNDIQNRSLPVLQKFYKKLKIDLQSGFTIVETMIVLAIAGIILLIVFQAIPALERNSRNNQRQQDVASILEATSHYELENSGDLPTSAQLCTYIQKYGNLSYYDATNCNNITFNYFSYAQDGDINGSPSGTDQTPPLSQAADVAANTNPGTVVLYNYEKCDSTHAGQSNGIGAGYNDVVALFAEEKGSGVNSVCQNI